MDVDTIQAGLDFVDVLQGEVQSCDVLVAVMGQRWLNIKDERGERRLENPEDFVRIEIATALERDIRVIPVLLDGVMMPHSKELPENLKTLARRNALQVKHDSFGSDVYRLTKQLELALRAAEDSKAMKEKEAHAQRQDEIKKLTTQADTAINLQDWDLAEKKLKNILALDSKDIQAQAKLELIEEKLAEIEAENKRKESRAQEEERKKVERREEAQAEEEISRKLALEKNRQNRLAREKQIAEEIMRQDALKKTRQQERIAKIREFFSGAGKLPVFIIGGIALLFLLGYIIKNTSVPVEPEPIRAAVTEIPATTTTTFILPTSTLLPTATELPTEIPPTPTPAFGVGSTMISEKDGMMLRYVPAGEFDMGSEQYDDEKPIHTVYLDAYWIDQTEVTNAMYAKCVSAGDCGEPSDSSSHAHDSYYGNSEFNDYPVMYVSWEDANDYCAWAERRLPTEAEWEKAARGGLDGKTYPWGDDAPVCEYDAVNGAKFDNDAGCNDTGTEKVASYSPNGYGIYDMAGNLWEWVADWYGSDYYANSSSSNPFGPDTGFSRVLRGGSWSYYGNVLRSALRDGNYPTVTYLDVGFRCSRSP